MSRTLSLIGAPSSAGAYAAGQERAPDAWRRHGVTRALEGPGRVVRDRGDTTLRRWTPDRERPGVDGRGGTRSPASLRRSSAAPPPTGAPR